MMNRAVAVCGLLVLACACKGETDPVEYNNKIMLVMNSFETDMSSINDAMGAQDYAKAKAAQKAWDAKLAESVKRVEDLGPFKGDSTFQESALASLKLFREVAGEDYAQLIKERESIQKGSAADPAKEQKLLSGINDKLEGAANDLNNASAAFQRSLNQ